jgi:hypothetical protein
MSIKSLAEKILVFETKGFDTEEELIEFFQLLIDNGLDPKTKGGKYTKIAHRLILEGKITSEPRAKSVSYLFD